MTICCRLLSPGLEKEGKYYRHASAVKSTLDLPVEQFKMDLWPGRGLTWAEAVDICEFLDSGRFGIGKHKLYADSLLLEVYEG